jgi:hypothetical protein
MFNFENFNGQYFLSLLPTEADMGSLTLSLLSSDPTLLHGDCQPSLNLSNDPQIQVLVSIPDLLTPTKECCNFSRNTTTDRDNRDLLLLTPFRTV